MVTISHAEAIVETVSQADDQLVTKADLQAALASLERRLIGYLIATVLVVPGAIKYLSTPNRPRTASHPRRTRR